MGWVVVAICTVFGLAIGSFLNVVIWRVPRGESIVVPGSRCPRCDHALRWYDNIPVLSWLVLRARCRDCGASISVRYPVIELVTAVLFGAVAVWLGPPTSLGEVLVLTGFLWLTASAVALSVIDLDVHRLPDVIVLPTTGAVLGLVTAAAAVDGDWSSWRRALLAGVALCALYTALLVAYPAGMGFGDVKLAGVLGVALGWVGWGALFVGGFAAFLFGGVYGAGALLRARGKGRRGRVGIPFGPWMFVGSAVGLVAGEPIWSGYLSLLGQS